MKELITEFLKKEKRNFSNCEFEVTKVERKGSNELLITVKMPFNGIVIERYVSVCRKKLENFLIKFKKIE